MTIVGEPQSGADVITTQPVTAGVHTPFRRWERRYVLMLCGCDAVVSLIAGLIAFEVRFGVVTHYTGTYVLLSVILPIAWFAAAALARAYEARFLFVGTEEYQRVIAAGVALIALLAVVSYAGKMDIARGYVVIALPGTILGVLVTRYAARKWVHRRRREGRFMQRVLLVGYERGVKSLAGQLHREQFHGMYVVGACLPQGWSEGTSSTDIGIDVYGNFDDVDVAVALAGADTVAILSTPEWDGEALRRLAWKLERAHVDLVVAPALMDVAGPRTTIRPVDGLPLLHVEHPALTGARRVAKEVFDRAAAGAALFFLSPVFGVLAVSVWLCDRGPAFFRQDRVGKNGTVFEVLKFRSMYTDAEARLAELREQNEGDGVLFKIRDDPRVTPVGKWLRRFSLDELPQLVNVVRGQMSLVGPRPPLPSEVEQYAADVRRRLVVKPGLTGLWQVSGRSDLSWDESVRLDLRYVENWSIALDVMILCRTLTAVVRSRGAY